MKITFLDSSNPFDKQIAPSLVRLEEEARLYFEEIEIIHWMSLSKGIFPKHKFVFTYPTRNKFHNYHFKWAKRFEDMSYNIFPTSRQIYWSRKDLEYKTLQKKGYANFLIPSKFYNNISEANQGVQKTQWDPFVIKSSIGFKSLFTFFCTLESWQDKIPSLPINYPIIHQKFIDSLCEVRFLTIGKKVFPFIKTKDPSSIYYNLNMGASILDVNTALSEGILTESLFQRTHAIFSKINDKLNFQFSACDFLISKTGNVYFLENNLAPGLIYVEKSLSTNFAEKVAKFLYSFFSKQSK